MQNLFLVFAFVNFLIFLKAFHECKNRNNPFGLTRWLTPLGSFVWGDALIFSLFWICVSLVSWFLNNWFFFGLAGSVFWVVRAFGEAIYWFNQQFSTIGRNPPESLPGFSFFKNDSIWFIHQIVWQCTTVIAIIASIYFAHGWLKTL